MEIENYFELRKAKERLTYLVDRHQYNQMLAGDSKLLIDPEILWLKDAIDRFEKSMSKSDNEDDELFNSITYF